MYVVNRLPLHHITSVELLVYIYFVFGMMSVKSIWGWFLLSCLCFFFFILLFAVSCGSPNSFSAFYCCFFASCCLLSILGEPQSPIYIGLHRSITQKNNHDWIGHTMQPIQWENGSFQQHKNRDSSK